MQGPLYFHDGSFVIHKVDAAAKKYSAWFNADGSLKDCEQTSPTVKCVNNNAIRDYLNSLGKRIVVLKERRQ